MNLKSILCLTLFLFSSLVSGQDQLNHKQLKPEQSNRVAAESNRTVQVTVVVGGVVDDVVDTPAKRYAVLSLFDSEDDFLEAPIQTMRQPVDDSGVAVFQLTGLLNKFYSTSVFFDADGNEELNTNFFGIPSEPVGFSNNAKGRFGPPSFEQTKFNPSDKANIEIRLITIGD